MISIKGTVKQDVRVVWKTPQKRGVEAIPKGTVVDVLNKFYNHCINGYYYRAKMPQNDAVYCFLPDDIEIYGKNKEEKKRTL